MRLRASVQSKPKQVENIVPPSTVSRFIYDSDKLYKKTSKPKPGAFMPEYFEAAKRHETSVCCLDGCSDERAWDLAKVQRPNKTLHARANFPVQLAIDQSLSCIAAPVDGFDEHAVIIEWPNDKEAQKVKAIELASGTAPCLRPPSY